MRRIPLWLGIVLLMSAPPGLADKWRTFENCTLVPNPSNDGDSFHVKVKRSEYIFRLYFADAPETDMSFPDRVAEQADYWGISPKAAVRLGHLAANFTRQFLADGFTVYTKMDDARGRSDKERFYAIVTVGEKTLSEELVRNGLARVFGADTDLPDGTKTQLFWWRLKTAEREAKKNRLGAFSPDIERASADETTGPSMPPPAAGPGLVERDVTLAYPVPVFSLKEPFQQVGQLQRGAQVRVLGTVSATMVRVRFAGSPGQILEAQCRRVDLGM